MKQNSSIVKTLTLLLVVTVMAFLSIACDGNGCGRASNPPSTPTPTPASTPTPTPTPDPGATNPPPLEDGTPGFATRYWDCCKPHCSWIGNVLTDVSPVGTCNAQNIDNGIDTLQNYSVSSCDGGDGYTCWNMAPYAVSDTLAYGYAAIPYARDMCGKCYQLDFTGTSHNPKNDRGSEALENKIMIVQVTNTGGDLTAEGELQFDLLIPGGGVGIFDACTKQWGATADQMGKRYGGFLSACQDKLGWDAPHDSYKGCVKKRCEDLFLESGREDLMDGCRWFVDWFEAADNPNLVFKEVECPDALNNVSDMLP